MEYETGWNPHSPGSGSRIFLYFAPLNTQLVIQLMVNSVCFKLTQSMNETMRGEAGLYLLHFSKESRFLMVKRIKKNVNDSWKKYKNVKRKKITRFFLAPIFSVSIFFCTPKMYLLWSILHRYYLIILFFTNYEIIYFLN